MLSLKDSWGLAAPDKAEGIRRAMNATLYGPPGVTFKYSDINFITLGALVENDQRATAPGLCAGTYLRTTEDDAYALSASRGADS